MNINNRIRLILKRTNIYYKLFAVDIQNKQHLPLTHCSVKRKKSELKLLLEKIITKLSLEKIKKAELKVDFAYKKSINAKEFSKLLQEAQKQNE